MSDWKNEPIIPGIGLGGVAIGMTSADVLIRLGDPLLRERNVDLELWEYESIRVLLCDSAVEKLYADIGYVGTTPQSVFVGMSSEELITAYSEVRFDEDEGLWRPTHPDGVGFEIWDQRLDTEVTAYARGVRDAGCSGTELVARPGMSVSSIIVWGPGNVKQAAR